MNYPTYEKTETARRLAEISEWIDEHNSWRDEEAQVWGRVSKIGEEFGEVIAEMISWTGQNPRKEREVGAVENVKKELMDVMLTAAAAYEHLTGNKGVSMEAFRRHVENVYERAGLEET